MIQLKSIVKCFNKGSANELYSLNNVDLSINKNDYLVIVGANGSGKSTLLNCIAGNLFPDSGSIYINNLDVTKTPDYSRSKWIARVFQNPLSGTAPDLSIIENFRLAALRSKSKGFKIGITNAFKQEIRSKISVLGMGLENKLEQPMGLLSGGQRQALTLLMAVSDDLKVLLLDEPTAALDPRSAELVMRTADQIIKDFDLTAILVTHQMKDVINYGNRVIQMQEGRVRRDLPLDEKQQLNLNDLYNWFN